jgi:putative ABC transport system permease protein
MLIATIGGVLGLGLLYLGLAIAQPIADDLFGLWLPIRAPGAREIYVLMGVILAAALAGLVPALRAYRLSLADGLTVKQ